jgi:hypothetical protein
VLGPDRSPLCPTLPDATIKAEGVNAVVGVAVLFDVTCHCVALEI